MNDAVDNLQAAQARAMAVRPVVGGFPVLAKVLREAGVHRNEWTLPSGQSLYRTDLGVVVQQGEPVETGTLPVPAFDEEALVRALRIDQAGQSTFPEFLAAAWRAGVVRYVADFDTRQVVYYGAASEFYTEAYPDVTIPEPQTS